MKAILEIPYIVVYLEILLLCFIYTAVLLFSVKAELGTETEVLVFKWILRIMLIALIIDAITHCQYRGAINLPIPIIAFCYSTYMFLFSGVSPLLWLIFAESRLGNVFSTNRKYLWFAIIPVIVMGIISYSSMVTGWFFSFDANGVYVRGPLWVVQSLFAYSYFLYTTVHAFILAAKQKSKHIRKQYYIIGSFVIAPIFGGLLQLFIGSHPFVAPSCTIAYLFIFVNIQSNMIYHDSLTRLNNRKMADEYLEEMIASANEYNAFYLFILDVNNFKGVNDTYGHVEGDNCLRNVAEVLKESINKYNGFIARFGGDEFISIIEESHIKNPEDYINDFNEILEKRCLQENIPYEISLSIGYARCADNKMDVSNLISLADKYMYQNKASKKLK